MLTPKLWTMLNDKKAGLVLLVGAVVFLFPLGAGWIKSWASGSFVVIFLLCLFLFFSYPPVAFCKAEKLLIFFILFFYLPPVLSFINSSEFFHGVHRVEHIGFYALSIVIYIALRRSNFSPVKQLCMGTILAGPVMLSVALWEILFYGAQRTSGFYNPILFGQISILFASISLAGIGHDKFGLKIRLLLFASSLCSVFVAITSGSRGPFLALPIVLLLLGTCWFIQKKFKLLVILIGIGGLIGGLVSLSPFVSVLQGRFYDLLNHSFQSDIRYQIWQDAITIFKENPILGTGIGDFEIDHRAMVESGVAMCSTFFAHAHNIYLDFFATTGIGGGFVLIISLFIVPFYIFTRNLQSGGEDDFLAGMIGLAVVISFAAFGLTSAWTARSAANASYALCLCVAMASSFNFRSLHVYKSSEPGV